MSSASELVKRLESEFKKGIEEDFSDFYTPENKYLYEVSEVLKTLDSDLEKIFFLIFKKESLYSEGFLIFPRQKVCVRNVSNFGAGQFFIEYEVDFAILAGSSERPLKIAIECDGLRSHREKYNAKDRYKSVNLQAAGWIVQRIGSREIHEEASKSLSAKGHISDLVFNIEFLIDNLSNSVVRTPNDLEIRRKIFGYTEPVVICAKCRKKNEVGFWDSVECVGCGEIIKINAKDFLPRSYFDFSNPKTRRTNGKTNKKK